MASRWMVGVDDHTGVSECQSGSQGFLREEEPPPASGQAHAKLTRLRLGQALAC